MNRNADTAPVTRYQGTKRTLLRWIWKNISHLEFETCLDLFSGGASVSYLFKTKGKTVTSNDLLRCNKMVAEALVVNEGKRLNPQVANLLTKKSSKRQYDDVVERVFNGMFFTAPENRWLDRVVQNIHAISDPAIQGLGLFSVFQACIAKRPFGAFNRANLKLRTSDVAVGSSFKESWHRPMTPLFISSVEKANESVFRSGKEHRAFCQDFREVGGSYDLVYLDPPYLNSGGIGVDYRDYYHFIEGLTRYSVWEEMIDHTRPHKPMFRKPNPWDKKDTSIDAFRQTLALYPNSILVISYRSDGIPAISDILDSLKDQGRVNVKVVERSFQYAMAQSKAAEVLIISEP